MNFRGILILFFLILNSITASAACEWLVGKWMCKAPEFVKPIYYDIAWEKDELRIGWQINRYPDPESKNENTWLRLGWTGLDRYKEFVERWVQCSEIDLNYLEKTHDFYFHEKRIYSEKFQKKSRNAFFVTYTEGNNQSQRDCTKIAE